MGLTAIVNYETKVRSIKMQNSYSHQTCWISALHSIWTTYAWKL